MFNVKYIQLPDYVKKKIWLNYYPKDYPKEVKIPKDKTLIDTLNESVAKWGDEAFMFFYGKGYTRKQVRDGAMKLAAALYNLGVRRDDVVAIYLPNCIQFLVAYYGILMSGATVTAISPLFVPREVAYQLKDSGAKTIVTIDLFYNNVKQIKGETQLKNIIVTSIGGEKLNIDKEDLDKIVKYEELMEKTPPMPPKIRIKPTEDVAVLQYTGGTTGPA